MIPAFGGGKKGKSPVPQKGEALGAHGKEGKSGPAGERLA